MNATIILLNVPIILFFKQRITKALIIIQMQLPWKLYESRGLLLAGCEFKNNISVILFPSLFILFENQTHHLVLMIFFESINLSVKARSITCVEDCITVTYYALFILACIFRKLFFAKNLLYIGSNPLI